MKVKERRKLMKHKKRKEKMQNPFWKSFLSSEVTDSIKYVKKENRLGRLKKFISSIILKIKNL